MNEEEIVSLILHGGDGRSCAMEAIEAAKQGEYSLAHQKLKEAQDALLIAHQSQISFIEKGMNGEKVNISLLMVHAQDHLKNVLTVKELAKEFVDLYERGDGTNGS